MLKWKKKALLSLGFLISNMIIFFSFHFASLILCFTLLSFVFHMFFSTEKWNSLECYSLNVDTQENLVLNVFLASEMTLILGFQIIVSFTAINIIQSRYFKIMEKTPVRKKELGPNSFLPLLSIYRISAK